jgi:hypothetical protein
MARQDVNQVLPLLAAHVVDSLLLGFGGLLAVAPSISTSDRGKKR